MPHIYTTDAVQIARVMRDYLNTWAAKPTTILFEDLGDGNPSMMLQSISSAEIVKQYIDGSYIGIWNFRVVIRVDGEDTAVRFDASAVLNDLDAWLEEKNTDGTYKRLPVIDGNRKATGIVIATTPSLAARYEDGSEDYQAVFQLEYKARRK